MYEKKFITKLVSTFNLSQSFNYMPYLFYKKRFKSEINSFCIWTPRVNRVSHWHSHINIYFSPQKPPPPSKKENSQLTGYVQSQFSMSTMSLGITLLFSIEGKATKKHNSFSPFHLFILCSWLSLFYSISTVVRNGFQLDLIDILCWYIIIMSR